MKEELKNSFEILKQEIEKTEIREDSKEKLESIINGIEKKLDDNAGAEEHNKLVGQVNDSVRHFEVTHPEIAKIMGRIFNILSNMGI